MKLFVTIIALVLLAGMSASAASSLPPQVNYGGEEAGDYVNGYDGESYSEEPATYDAASKTMCKLGHGKRFFKSWLGFKVWQYNEDVRYCYNGSVVTSSQRWRWAEIYGAASYYWSFEGHVGNSCATESCSDQKGTQYTYYRTQGKFKACWVLQFTVCNERLPWVSIVASAMGTGQFSSGG